MKNIINWLKTAVGEKVVALVLARLLTKENILKAIDYVLDIGEEFVKKSEPKWDDNIFKKIRESLNIPEFENK